MKTQQWLWRRMQMPAAMMVAALAMLLALIVGIANPAHAADFLEPEQAFKLTATRTDARTVRLAWKIAPDYHLYRERLSFEADGVALATPRLPDGIRKFDTNFNKEMETYQDQLVVDLPLASGKPMKLTVNYQGCADAGLCYAPASASYAIDPAKAGVLTALPADGEAALAAAPAGAAPAVLLTFGALLFVLSLSMFDVYQLQLPSSLQSKLSSASGNMGGGKFAGVFVMGALSALIVGPCVAGPLAGALLYISQTRNVWTGGWALFSMAVGMSVPLLLTGISAGSLLPRAGGWMNGVKKLFGLLLIATAIWMITPVFSATTGMVLWGVFALLCAAFLNVFESAAKGAGLGTYVGKALGMALLLVGVLELTGAASGGRDVLQPLGHLAARGGDAGAAPAAADAHFPRIKTVAELDQVLATTRTPVMLDFYADWCVSCKEMERFTFSQQAVKDKMAKIRVLQVDVTANNADDKALMKRFGLFGPPGMILFKDGQEVPGSRVIGFMKAEPFLNHLNRHFP